MIIDHSLQTQPKLYWWEIIDLMVKDCPPIPTTPKEKEESVKTNPSYNNIIKYGKKLTEEA